MKYGLIYSHEFSKYDYGAGHPFKLERGERFYQLLERYQLLSDPDLELIRPQPISEPLFLIAHSPDYLKALKEADAGSFKPYMLQYGLGGEDCPVFSGVYQFSRLSAGATLEAMLWVLEKRANFVFNPVGGFHHARRAYAEGFCYLNDINIIGRLLLLQGYKVAYLDFDAHHGNGVQEEFYSEPNFLFISFHENGKFLYPGSGFENEIGAGAGEGFTVNVPLEPNCDDEIFLELYYELVPPLLEAFSADFALVLFGADANISDPLTHLRLTNNSLAEVAEDLKKRFPRWLGLGAGGYNLEETSRSWALVWAVITGQEQESDLSMVGGTFLGGGEVGVSSFRDPRAYSSGPEKEKAYAEAKRVLKYLKREVFPRVGAK